MAAKKRAKEPEAPKSKGRPTLYTPEIAATICKRLSDGESLRSICRPDDMPAESTVRHWALEDTEGFFAHYAKARDLGMDALADELLDIADTPEIGEKRKTDAEGKTEVTEGDMIEHRRLRVDVRKWYLSKVAPKKYGDRVNVDHGVQDSLAEVMREIDGRTRGLPNGN